MKKTWLFVLVFLAIPLAGLAQSGQEEIFKAEVIEIIDQREIIDELGSTLVQQDLKLKALNGRFTDQEIIFTGIGDLQVISVPTYEAGDKVMVNYDQGPGGEDGFFILDHDRTNPILWLVIIFVFSVLIIGRWKGFRSLIALVVSFFVILKFIIPKILAGSDPVLISIIGGIFILVFAVYLTQGFNRKAQREA